LLVEIKATTITLNLDNASSLGVNGTNSIPSCEKEKYVL